MVLVGRDTRRSGAMLQSALLAGLMAQSVDVVLLDEFTTPGVSFLTAQTGATFGVVVSASHNPYWDNGIKVFEGHGFKASDDLEAEIERLALDGDSSWHNNASDGSRASAESLERTSLLGNVRPGMYSEPQTLVPTPISPSARTAFSEGITPGNDAAIASADGLPGTVRLTRDLGETYVSHLLQAFGGEGALRGLRVVLDCANGAASYLAPEVFRRLGAEVVALNVWPNGVNINVNCGTEGDGPRRAGQAVVAAGADIGFVFDGDADRCKFLDEQGQERDGDYILAILARELQDRKALAGAAVVTTDMANLGLDLSLRDIGIALERTQVGDKWVSARMRERGYVLGGEQSGHIILFENDLTTGDGLYTALRISQLLLRRRPLRFSRLAENVLTKVPQVLDKAEVPAKPPLEELPGLQAQLARLRQTLGNDTLVNVRYSGTEPVVRVMIQGAGHPVQVLQREAQAILRAVTAGIATSVDTAQVRRSARPDVGAQTTPRADVLGNGLQAGGSGDH